MQEDGKRLRTRSGDSVRLVDLLDEAAERTFRSMKERAEGFFLSSSLSSFLLGVSQNPNPPPFLFLCPALPHPQESRTLAREKAKAHLQRMALATRQASVARGAPPQALPSQTRRCWI